MSRPTTLEDMGMVLSSRVYPGRPSWVKRFSRNADGSIALPLCGIVIGAGHTAFPGDKVWDDSGIWEKPMTFIGYALEDANRPKDLRAVICEEVDILFWPEQLFPSAKLAAMSRRKRILKLYRKRRKWMLVYRDALRELDRFIEEHP